MSYDKNHSRNERDKCLKNVGFKNLTSLPFLYCDKNDNVHPDMSHLVGYKTKEGYRQYFVCVNK